MRFCFDTPTSIFIWCSLGSLLLSVNLFHTCACLSCKCHYISFSQHSALASGPTITFRPNNSENLNFTSENFSTVKSFIGINPFQFDVSRNPNPQLLAADYSFFKLLQFFSVFFMCVKLKVKYLLNCLMFMWDRIKHNDGPAPIWGCFRTEFP